MFGISDPVREWRVHSPIYHCALCFCVSFGFALNAYTARERKGGGTERVKVLYYMYVLAGDGATEPCQQETEEPARGTAACGPASGSVH